MMPGLKPVRGKRGLKILQNQSLLKPMRKTGRTRAAIGYSCIAGG